ncbi:hypothetical protein PybrP1_003801 [[Pythium] brassicae (nom. inval.)]|nr:hypothetical protein PybrP1_003801 [[Pythium] brassicae (nom. inval.)]
MSFSMKLPAAKGGAAKKQYGLILPPSATTKESGRPAVFNAFAQADADAGSAAPAASEAELRRRVAADAARSVRASEVEKAHSQALAQDATVFDYDGVYDELTSERRDSAARRRALREAEKKQPKYIGSLLQKAKIREIENERIRERRLLNERRAEDALYGDKEKLVSASYKRKLQEQRQWDDEDARLDALEDAEDVTKRGELAMAGFYANLLHKNLAMGGSTANATSAYTVRTDAAEPPQELREKRRRTAAARERSASPSPLPLPLPPLPAPVTEAPAAPTQAVGREEESDAKPSKEEAIAAAKARFLARKAQRAQSAAASASNV